LKKTTSLKKIFTKVACAALPCAVMAAPVPATAGVVEGFSPINDTCFQLDHDAEKQPQQIRDILNEFREISSYNTYLSSGLYHNAYYADYNICVMALDNGAGALWHNDRKSISLSNGDEPTARKLSYLFHEFAHARQDQENLLHINQSWSPYELHQTILLREAAAKTTEYVTAYDLSLYGYNTIWDHISRNDRRSTLLAEGYQSRYADSQNHGVALTAAAKAHWDANIVNRSWLNFYTRSTIRSYLYKYQTNRIRRDNGKAALTLEDIRTSVPMPDGRSLFETLDETPSRFEVSFSYQQIMNHMQIEHYAAVYGRNSEEYRLAYMTYDGANNIYKDVDLSVVNRRAENISVQFECLSGRRACTERNGEYTIDPVRTNRRNGQIIGPGDSYRHPDLIPR